MNSLHRFIVTPKKDRYNNTIKVGDKDLVINTKIETFQSVSKEAIVYAIPKVYKGDINIGDEVIIHHNVFRRFYDIKGKEKNSGSYFKEDLYFVEIAQIYLYKKDNKWISNLDYCFVSPLESEDNFSIKKEKPLTGILKYGNKYLIHKGVKENMIVTFTPNSEFEFIVDNELLYCMKSNDIALIYEQQENKIKYNPSWA